MTQQQNLKYWYNCKPVYIFPKKEVWKRGRFRKTKCRKMKKRGWPTKYKRECFQHCVSTLTIIFSVGIRSYGHRSDRHLIQFWWKWKESFLFVINGFNLGPKLFNRLHIKQWLICFSSLSPGTWLYWMENMVVTLSRFTLASNIFSQAALFPALARH